MYKKLLTGDCSWEKKQGEWEERGIFCFSGTFLFSLNVSPVHL